MNLIVDTHAHYDEASFNTDRDAVLSSLPQNDILCVINSATDLKSAEKSLKLSEKYAYIFATIGIHPLNTRDIPADFLTQISKLLNHKKAVGIGEIGLDYHYDASRKDFQNNVFGQQLKLALELDLPVVVHDREAHAHTLSLLKRYRPKGVVHCFSGDLKMAEQIISLGMYIGVGGVVTFKNAQNTVNVVQNIPLERLLLETDAPYLAPAPQRGTRCDSTMIKHTAEKIAEIRNITLEHLLERTKENSCKLFNLNL